MEFIQGEVYEFCFVIEGNPIPVQASFTGEGCTINGMEFGYFENTTTGKRYLLSKEGFAKMQPESWDAEKERW
tara:strand:- start:236 stop:454 length:219 start_codon:yes stop_codon:yes gene_type:complete